jgi:dienelactone hydrolase
MKISFISSGYRLAGNLFLPKGESKKLAFLFIQGWTGHQNLAAAELLANQGFPTMTYDMRGNRESEGNLAEFSRADFVKDAAVAYDYFREQISADTAIGVAGSSFGSYTAVLLSKARDVAALSLRVPASYPDEGFDKPQQGQGDPFGIMDWRKKPLDYTQNRAFKALHDFKGEVQIIEAEKDELVPARAPKNYAEAVVDKSHLTYEAVPGAPHRLENDDLREDYEKRLAKWVAGLMF